MHRCAFTGLSNVDNFILMTRANVGAQIFGTFTDDKNSSSTTTTKHFTNFCSAEFQLLFSLSRNSNFARTLKFQWHCTEKRIRWSGEHGEHEILNGETHSHVRVKLFNFCSWHRQMHGSVECVIYRFLFDIFYESLAPSVSPKLILFQRTKFFFAATTIDNSSFDYVYVYASESSNVSEEERLRCRCCCCYCVERSQINQIGWVLSGSWMGT